MDTVFLGAFRRRVFEEVGLYDPEAITNEDAELNQRILGAGGKIFLSREVVVHYYPRESFRALARQYFRYGRGRARTLLKHRGLVSLRPVVPAALVVAGVLLLATARLQPFTPWVLGAFAALSLFEAVRVARGSPGMVLTAWAIFPVLITSHGLGFLAGLARHLRHRDWVEPERLPARGPMAGVAEEGG